MKKKRQKDLKYSGWLKKKGKKRWFCIVDDWLFWFNKEPDELQDGTKNPKSWKFLSQSNGNLYLSRCNVSNTPKEKEIVIVNPSGKNYILVGKDVNEIQQWKAVIQQISDMDTSELPNYTDGQLIEKRGLLRYRGEPHWFVLKEGALMWFKSEEDTTLVGSTTLYNATVAVGTTKTGVGFVVATVEDKFIVGCENREKAEEWVTYMRAAISAAKQSRARAAESNKLTSVGVSNSPSQVEFQKLEADVQLGSEHAYKGYLMYEGQSLAFLLRADVIMWFKAHISDLAPSNIKKHIKGHIVLHPDRVQLTALPTSNDSQSWRFGFRLTVQGVSHDLLAQTSNDRDDWIGCINNVFVDLTKKTKLVKSRIDGKKVLDHEGWLIRKRVKKWICVRDSMMHVFDKPGQAGQAKVTILLAGCTTLQSEDPGSSKQLMLFSSEGELEVLESICKKSEEALADINHWFYILFNSIFQANQNPAMMDSSSRPQTEIDGGDGGDSYYEQQRAGWMQVKKDGIDYFFTLKSLSLIWYKSDNFSGYKGSILLCGCSTAVSGTELSISGSDERTLIKVITSSPDDARGWALALEDAIQSANEAKGYRKFGYLERKGKRRWMVLTKTHLFWFGAPRRLEDLRANKGDQLQLPNCSVTTQGDAIVVTERIVGKGGREGVTVELLTASNSEEQADWVAALLTCVTREYSKDFLGIPYAVFTYMVSENDPFLLALETMQETEEQLGLKVLTPPESATLFQTQGEAQGDPLVEENADVVDPKYRIYYQPDDVGTDQFVFQFSSASLQIDGVASIEVTLNDQVLKRGRGAKPDINPHSLSKSASMASISPRKAKATPRPPPRSPRGGPGLRASLHGLPAPSAPAPRPPGRGRGRGRGRKPGGEAPSPQPPRRQLPPSPTPGSRPLPPLRPSDGSLRKSANLPLRGGHLSPRSMAMTDARWIAKVFLYQRAKRKLEAGRWVAVAEDVTRVQTPESLCARQDLEGLVMENPSKLVSLLLKKIPITDADQAIQAVINVHASHGEACDLILRYITTEVAEANRANTLFRTNSPATKMMKSFSSIIGRTFLHDTLAENVKAIVETKGGWEIDAERCSADEDISLNLDRVMTQCEAFLNSIFASLSNFPLEFHRISEALGAEVGKKFPEHRKIAIGGFLFLRFFCPAIVAPESYGLTPKPPNSKARRGLTLVAKTLQNISNGKVFGTKEGFMCVMNPLIERFLPLVEDYLDKATVVPMGIHPTQTSIPKRVVVRSLETIYKQCVLQKRKMAKDSPQYVTKNLIPIIKAIGIAPNLRRVLMIQQKASAAKKEPAKAESSPSLPKSPRPAASPRGKRNK